MPISPKGEISMPTEIYALIIGIIVGMLFMLAIAGWIAILGEYIKTREINTDSLARTIAYTVFAVCLLLIAIWIGSRVVSKV